MAVPDSYCRSFKRASFFESASCSERSESGSGSCGGGLTRCWTVGRSMSEGFSENPGISNMSPVSPGVHNEISGISGNPNVGVDCSLESVDQKC